MSIFEFAEGVTMHGFNHVFVKDRVQISNFEKKLKESQSHRTSIKEQKTIRTVTWSTFFLGSVALFICQVTSTGNFLFVQVYLLNLYCK